MTLLGKMRMSKRDWYRAGGLSNNWLCRRMIRGAWSYWQYS
jgi:hypothetical protein